MIRGIALAQHILPVAFVEEHSLARRLTDRGGEVEYQFLWTDQERFLPVLDADGGLRLVTWGNRREEARELPVGRCTQLATIAAGSWDRWQHQPVDIPTTLVLEGSVWTFIREGARGLLVRVADGVERVYVIVEPASYYYNNVVQLIMWCLGSPLARRLVMATLTSPSRASMKPQALVLPVLALLFASVCLASIPTDFFLLDCSQGYFRVDEGKLQIGARSGRENQKAPEHWYVLGTRIKSSVDGGYLAYDHAGKDRQVYLATKTGENTEWVITRKVAGEQEYAIVKAAKGPFKGWSLDVEEGHLVLREKPSNPVKVARIYRSL